jgi:sarcosine oxidase subunit beta
MSAPDVVIVGGGVVGLASAAELAARGARVTVVDRGSIAGQASSRNGGQLSPGIDGHWAPFARRALEMWPALAAELGEIGFVQDGGLYVVMAEDPITPDEIVAYRRGRGFTAEAVTPRDCASLLPGVSTRIKGGVLSPKHGQMDPHLATQALARRATAARVRLEPDTPVTGIDVEGGRVRGVRTPHGSMVAEWIVIAAAPWSREVGALAGIDVPVRPRRIQIVMTAAVSPLTRMVWGGNGLYSRQDAHGRLHFGAEGPPWDPPAEHFDCDVTAPTLQRIARRMVDLMPALAPVHVTRAWAGIIAPTPDLAPIVDAVAEPRGLVLACGFGGNGFGTSPAFGESVAELITTGRTSIDISGLSLSRFAPEAVA